MMRLLSKQEKVATILRRDGNDCFICKKPFDGEKPTIEHWIPRSAGGSDEMSNLRLTHKDCNILKGDIIPNDDNTITMPPRKQKPRKNRNDRKDILDRFCYDCEGGRRLKEKEFCSMCGSPPGPPENPRYLKRRSPECDHNIFWCWACSIGIVEKKSAMSHLMTG